MTPSQTPGTQFIAGIPLNIPNFTYDGKGFYISYNDRDSGVYGSDTTALVVNDSTFYILNGDHRMGYSPLVDQGIDACVSYFYDNICQRNRYSD